MNLSIFENDQTLGLASPFDDIYGGGGWDDPIYPIYPLDPPIYDPPPVIIPPTPTQAVPPASWAVGTFYGSARGLNIILTISPGGSATANVNGSLSNGTLSGTSLHMGNAVGTVSQLSNGIRTVSGGETIDYSTTPPAPVYVPPVYTPPTVTPPVPLATLPVKTPPVKQPATTTPASTISVAGVEIDSTTLLIAGGLVAAYFLLK